jgi:xanthine/uracil/vitamin C permease (AzgA family)
LLLSTKATNTLQKDEIAGATLTKEVRAGLTTFFTMAYIIAVNVILTEPFQM